MPDSLNRYLIVNADDFGISESISKGIIFSHTYGAVSSTTAITNGSYFEKGAELAKECPDLGIGVHLNLDEEVPVLPASEIPSIVNDTGRFYSRWEIIFRVLRGSASLNHIKAEWRAQIQRCLDMNIEPTHLDSHGHIYHLPRLQSLVGQLATEFKIRAVRRTTVKFGSLLKHPQSFLKASLLWGCGKLFDRQKDLTSLHHISSIGLEESGRVTYKILIQNIRSLQPGITEIMLHPGFTGEDNQPYRDWDYRWEAELQAVVDSRVLDELKSSKIVLVNHRQIQEI